MACWRMLAVALVTTTPLAAQQDTLRLGRPGAAAGDTALLAKPTPTATLTLSQALEQARSSNPTFRQALNQVTPAKVGVRAAWGDYLPTLNASGGVTWTGSGQTIFGGTTFNQPSAIGSNYSIDAGWSLSGATFFNTGRAKATQKAVEADVDAARIAVGSDVATQYLNGMQAAATSDVARQQVRRNFEFLTLTRARNRVGQTSLFDVRQAEVTYNNSEVDLLRTLQLEQEAKIELFRLMGINPPAPIEQIALTDSFPTTEPEFDIPALVREAGENNPQLQALRARERAAASNVKAAQSQYFPSLSAFANKSGFTNQFSDTTGGNFNTGDFPFKFQGQPPMAGIGISLPIFTGFQRDLQVSQAHAQQKDFQEQVREQELGIGATVNSRVIGVETAWRAMGVQDRSRLAARDQLKLAEERYRLGSGTVLEVSDALNAVTGADASYVNAVYDYHRAMVALFAVLGRRYNN